RRDAGRQGGPGRVVGGQADLDDRLDADAVAVIDEGRAAALAGARAAVQVEGVQQLLVAQLAGGVAVLRVAARLGAGDDPGGGGDHVDGLGGAGAVVAGQVEDVAAQGVGAQAGQGRQGQADRAVVQRAGGVVGLAGVGEGAVVVEVHVHGRVVGGV